MPLTSDQQAALSAALNRIFNFYDGDHDYNAATYPGAFRNGGSVVNFYPALKDVATVMQFASTLLADAMAASANSPKALRVDSAQSFTDAEVDQAITNLRKVVRFDEGQALTDAEAAQVLTNLRKALRFDAAQTLTDTEKAQVLTNLSYALRADATQSLTDIQKAQLLSNLGFALRFDAAQSLNATQLAQALSNLGLANGGLVPAGAMLFFGMLTPPTGWLKTNGASYLRASYPALFNAIGTTFGSVDGNSFNMPDVRAYIPRPLDDGRGVDASRVIGSLQADAILSHGHGSTGTFLVAGGGTYWVPSDASHGYLPLTPTGSNVAAVGGAENRVKNIALPFFIKY